MREGIAANLATIPGLRTSAFIPDNPTPPIAVVAPSRVEFDNAMHRGMDSLTFDVTVIAVRSSERSAQRVLDSYCDSAGPTSVKAAIQTDRTLGGAAFDCRVTEMSGYGPLLVGEVSYLSATFTVVVIANT